MALSFEFVQTMTITNGYVGQMRTMAKSVIFHLTLLRRSDKVLGKYSGKEQNNGILS